MAEGAIKAAADSCIGSLITLTTKSGMRYEGCLNHVDAQECTIALHSGFSLLLLLRFHTQNFHFFFPIFVLVSFFVWFCVAFTVHRL